MRAFKRITLCHWHLSIQPAPVFSQTSSEMLLLACLLLILSTNCCDADQADNVLGIGHATEVPISSLTLFMPEPKVLNNEPRNFKSVEDEEDTGEGIIEMIPINAIKVRFNPAIHRNKARLEETKTCEEICKIPALPAEMTNAVKNCNGEQDTHLSLAERRRQGRPDELMKLKRLCSSKCVLEKLNLLQADGMPDADRVTGFLLKYYGFEWTKSLRVANQVCSMHILRNERQETAYNSSCAESVSFMKCIHTTIVNECPESFKVLECQTKSTAVA
ncbi:Hypothetical predicted protein [Cloeon dipterum]|uniref:Uncharacterized protein n=2 Tax=Cloeon dipterum TaxID=197152 RepID=A0A8S1E0I5_9INSE|nr:Hypothetical predicted protein [Cloeon dipterum]